MDTKELQIVLDKTEKEIGDFINEKLDFLNSIEGVKVIEVNLQPYYTQELRNRYSKLYFVWCKVDVRI